MESGGASLYQLILTNRENLQAGGITEVENFDEHEIVARSQLGPLVIKGENLHITQLNLESGQLVLEGRIHSVQYLEDKRAKAKARGKGIMERLLK